MQKHPVHNLFFGLLSSFVILISIPTTSMAGDLQYAEAGQPQIVFDSIILDGSASTVPSGTTISHYE